MFAVPAAAPLHLPAFVAPAPGSAAIVRAPSQAVSVPRKKRNGCLVALAVLLVLTLAGVVVIFAFVQGFDGYSGIAGAARGAR